MVVEEFRASGQSMQAFCLPRGISINSLSRWLKRGEMQTESGSSAFAVVQVNSSAQRLFAARDNFISIQQRLTPRVVDHRDQMMHLRPQLMHHVFDSIIDLLHARFITPDRGAIFVPVDERQGHLENQSRGASFARA